MFETQGVGQIPSGLERYLVFLNGRGADRPFSLSAVPASDVLSHHVDNKVIPFNASCSKSLLFDGFNAILV